jgi:hypothetical protein
MADAVPAWVKKRDGRVVVFDPDVISQDLFNATEALGHGDAFLARELTEGVLHFLAADDGNAIPTTDSIAELVVKVVRELRQPALAQAFAGRPRQGDRDAPQHPERIAQEAMERFALATVFTRDVAAAHREGLLQLTGLAAPLQLAAAVLAPGPNIAQAIADARRGIAGWLVLDGPEYALEESELPEYVRTLAPVLQATGLTARLQLNCANPPRWAVVTAHGPLFAEPPPLIRCSDKAEALRDAVLALDSYKFVIDWHLGASDFEPSRHDALLKLAQCLLNGRSVACSFDRPRREVLLGPGLDRNHPALLMTVGVDLACLLQHVGKVNDIERLLPKLASLAGLAVSAGVQKRQFLRGDEADAVLERSLLRERARLLVAPIGLEAVVRQLTASDLGGSKEAVDVGRRILQQLSETLAAEGQRRLVDCVIDAPHCLGESQEPGEFVLAPARQQLRFWDRPHSGTPAGSSMVSIDEGAGPREVAELLEFAWNDTGIGRLRLQRRPSPAEHEPRLLAW